MSTNKTFSILYFEDEEYDAQKFREIVCDMLAKYSGANPKWQEASNLQEFFSEIGIEWVRNKQEFISALEKDNDYRLFLLDMKISGNTVVDGWDIIDIIRKKRQNTASLIWILSLFAVFEKPANDLYFISNFFIKKPEGYSRLQQQLTELFFPIGASSNQYIDLLRSDAVPYRMNKKNVVSIEKRGRDHIIFELKGDSPIAEPTILSRKKIFDSVVEEIQKGTLPEFVQISFTTIVNIKYVTHVYRDKKKGYYLTLLARSESLPIPVVYAFLDNLKEKLGDPLPVSYLPSIRD